jgi:hypothetical protein
MFTSHFQPVILPTTPGCGIVYVKWQNSSHTPHNMTKTAKQKYSYNYAMMGQIPDDNRMSVYMYDGPITIEKRTGGAVFCDTTSDYGIQRDGASCFDIGASGPISKENVSACAQQPVFSSFLRPFSQKIAFLLCTKLAHLPALISLFQPIHTHTLNQLHSNIGIRPTLDNPLEHDVMELRLHMTSHPFLHTRI